ncbi:hypothetical protein FD04_GL001076 [Secundilactobacillus odoratitofui DSM 19909 = JCM 15043]|uniref:SCP domain-containing protein n=2 Tax=Secundilactobacillus odoratitofui TaxID=480930 RepID=A0A0R1M0M5_9LACO|nr:CAP domain-containing protein [Secundilactobacillus odoratitofui]KRK98098.1 hypothetical protein FD04_GL001076 [Secundilactobacillus odoratitofui DSM 19909 = JCM 15043]
MSKLFKICSLIIASTSFAGALLVSKPANASTKTKVRYYQNIKNATYTIRNKRAVVYTTAKLNHKKVARLGEMGPKVTGYYAAHITKNGKRAVYYKFKTTYGSTGWVWNGWLKKVTKTTTKTIPGSGNNSSVDKSNAGDNAAIHAFTLNQSEYVNAFLSELNQERLKRGLSGLKLDVTLTQIAKTRASEISVNFTHYDPSGVTYVSKYAKQYGINYSILGEVITQNYPTAPTNRNNGETWGEDTDDTSSAATLPKNPTSAELAHSDLMTYLYDDASSAWGHRDNLLNSKYTNIGIAVSYNSSKDRNSYSVADLSN